MKRAFLALAVAVLMTSGTGCLQQRMSCNSCGDCQECDQVGSRFGQPNPIPRIPHGGYNQQINSGPPVGATAYPYYTTRAPRDFLLDNPPTIGY